MKSTKQQTIISFAVQNNGKITTKQAIELLDKFYYHNGPKYISEVLTRMVRSNKLVREKQGNYALPHKINLTDSKQLDLWET